MAGSSSRWLWGPVPDLLLGCGIGYGLLFGALCVYGTELRTGGGLAVVPFLVMICSTPHYGATLLRVYARSEDRRAYTLFAVHATVLIFAAFAVGVHQAWVGSLLLTVYLTWSPWHYTGQNYGITLMLLRRRNAAPSPRLKRLLYGSFFCSFLLTFLAQHGGGPGNEYAPLAYAGAGYRFLSLGLPEPEVIWALRAVGLAYVGTTIAATVGLVRTGGARSAAPSLVLMASQSLWFSIPLAARHFELGQQFEPLARARADYYFLFVAIAHSIQYLWITSWYARRQGDSSRVMGYSLRALFAGALVWVVPALLFAPGILGRLPFDAGLNMLVASAVNIHHFVLDGAIWKLRDGRVARVLLRPRPAQSAPPVAPTSWPAHVLLGVGAACAAVMLVGLYEAGRAERALAANDLTAAGRSLQHLSFVGRASASGHLALGDLLLRAGRLDGAQREYGRALELRPDAPAWQSMAVLHARRGDWSGATEAYERALAAAPDQAILYYEYGRVALKAGARERAREAFRRAMELDPGRRIYARMLQQVEAQLKADGEAEP